MPKACPLLPALLLLFTACDSVSTLPEEAPAISTVFEIPFDTRLPAQLELWTVGGHVLVRHGPRLKCEVDVRVFARTIEEAAIRAATVQFSLTTTEPGVERLAITHAEGALLSDVDLQFRVEVPPSIGLRVLTLVGEVALRGARGPAEVQTRTGNVEARVASIPGALIRLESESGTLRLEGEYHAAHITTRGGRVHLVAPRRIPAARALARTASGAITLYVDERSSVAVDYTTRSGRFDSDIPLRWEKQQALTGDGRRRSTGTAAGSEGRWIHLFAETEGGPITIRRRFAGL